MSSLPWGVGGARGVSQANYDVVAEYAAALEAENLELRSVEVD